LSGNARVFSLEFKVTTAQRIINGESVSALFHELAIKRSVLYRWRDAYRKEGAAGLSHPAGRPPGTPNLPRQGAVAAARPEQAAAEQIAALQRKIGQQVLQIDFLQGAFRRVKELRQRNITAGGTASTERSGE